MAVCVMRWLVWRATRASARTAEMLYGNLADDQVRSDPRYCLIVNGKDRVIETFYDADNGIIASSKRWKITESISVCRVTRHEQVHLPMLWAPHIGFLSRLGHVPCVLLGR
jgi:hypothetical protein